MSEQCRRVGDEDDVAGITSPVIAYWRMAGRWMLHIPGVGLGDLSNHDVLEHEDGTITVRPSILVRGQTTRHGFIERGAWRDA